MDRLKLFRNVIISGLLMIIGYFTNQNAILILAIVIGGYEETLEGLKDTFENKSLNVELLMILSAIGATLIGYTMEGAILIFIFALAGSLEEVTLDRSQREIQSLMELQPTEANLLLKDGSTKIVEVSSLKIHDQLIVAVGETIPTDAIIISGTSSLEEAAITGESLPVEKTKGDHVFGGTLNMSQPLTLEVDTHVTDTLLQRIVKMVSDAQNYPSKTARLIDEIEDKYARGVILAVVLTILIPIIFLKEDFSSAFYRGMILLVVASPCALVASVTPATLSAISNGARRGILVKGGIHFENMMDAKAIAFDKTGTLTKGIPSLTNIEFNTEDTKDIINAVMAIEKYSTHPLAGAICQGLLRQYDIDQSIEATDIEERSGYGIEGLYKDKKVRIGKLDYMIHKDETLLKKAEAWSSKGESLVYISVDDNMVGAMGLIDEVRPESVKLIQELKAQGIETIMITGDNHKTANQIGKQLGVDRILSETLPDHKVHVIQELEKEFDTVVMVGDGINDAPALANASIGIAMGGGTDIAMEAADIILVKDNIESVGYAIKLSRKLRKIVIQNIVFSLSVILVLVASNFVDKINLPLGVVGHEGSTILVILNSLRLLKKID